MSALTKQDRLIHELVETERRYVDKLTGLIHYKAELLRAGVMSHEEAAGVFLNIQTLHSVHAGLLGQLTSEGDKGLEEVTDAMQEFIPYLKVISMYASQCDGAVELLKELRANREAFATVLEGISWGNSDKGFFGLTNMHILPVQRTPRYRMFFGEFVKLTPAGHPLHEKVHRAYDAISEVARHLELKRRDQENLERLAALNLMIAGSDLSPLHDPNKYMASAMGLAHAFRAVPMSLPADASVRCDYCCLSVAVEPHRSRDARLSLVASTLGNLSSARAREAASSYYRCKACGYCVHQSCYTKPPPRCGEGREVPSLVQVGRRVIYEQYVLCKELGASQGRMTPTLLVVMNDSVLLIDHVQDELIDLCYYVTPVARMHTHDLFAYGASFALGSSSPEVRVHVVHCESAQGKRRLMARIARTMALWEHACLNRDIKQVEGGLRRASEHASLVQKAARRATKQLVVSTRREGKECVVLLTRKKATVRRTVKQLMQLHEMLKGVYENRALPPFLERKHLANWEGEETQARVYAFIKGTLKLPDVGSRREVKMFFGATVDTSRSASLATAGMMKHGGGLGTSIASSTGTHAHIPLVPQVVASGADRRRLIEMLDTPLSLIFFRKFMESTGNEHLLDFFFEVQQLRTLRGLKQIRVRANDIYDRFIRVDASRERHLPLSEAQIRATAASFQSDSDVVSYSAVFNEACGAVFDWMAIESYNAFGVSEEWRELMRLTSQDEVSLRGIRIHTQCLTIAGHIPLRGQFVQYAEAHYVPELWRGWMELNELHTCVTSLQGRVHRSHESIRVDVDSEGEEERTRVIRKQSLGAFGVKMTDMHALPSGASAKAPMLPSVSYSPNHNLHLLYNYLRYWHDAFMLDASPLCITFTVACKRVVEALLERVGAVLDEHPDDAQSTLALVELDFSGLVDVGNEMEVNLSDHLLRFIAKVEKERMKRVSQVSHAKTQAIQELVVPAEKKKKKKKASRRVKLLQRRPKK